MEKLEKFYETVITFLTHCIDQGFIPESEEEYILDEIQKIKDQIVSEN